MPPRSSPRACFLGLAHAIFLLLVLWVAPAYAQETEGDVYIAQAILDYDSKRYPEALGLLNEALKLDPDNLNGLYYTGLIHLAMKKPDLAVEYLEKASRKSPRDLFIRMQLGVAYFTLEQYDKAAPLLSDVFAEQPRLENVGYYVGFMRYRQKDYQSALAAFKTGASTDPTIRQLTRFYAGLTLGILGLPEQAAREVEEALKILPGSALTGPAERIRDTVVKAREREQRLKAEVRLGAFYDDNISVNPQFSSDPLVQSLRNTPDRGGGRSTGEIASVRTDYSWFRSGPWEATATYGLFHSQPNNPGLFRSGKIQSHLGGLAGFYRGTLGAMPYQLGTQYTYDYLLLNDAAFLERHTATLFGTLVEDPGNLTTVVGRLQAKNFLLDATTPPQDNRNAHNWMLGPTHVFRFAGDQHIIRVGYQFDIEDAAGTNFSYKGHRLLTGGQYTLPWGETRLRYDYEIHFRDYRHANLFLPTTSPNTMTRTDTEQLHVFRIEKPLPNNLTLSTEYQGTFSNSNIEVFNFHRNVFSVILTWTY